MCYKGFLPFNLSAKIFYTAAKEYYDTAKQIEQQKNINNIYRNNYYGFLRVLRLFLVDYQLYGDVITKDEFRLYAELFREEDDKSVDIIMENETFLLDEEPPQYIKTLKRIINTSDIYN